MDTTERRATGTPIREVLGFEDRLTAIEHELKEIRGKLDVLAVAQLGTDTSLLQLCNVLDLIDMWMDEMEAKR